MTFQRRSRRLRPVRRSPPLDPRALRHEHQEDGLKVPLVQLLKLLVAWGHVRAFCNRYLFHINRLHHTPNTISKTFMVFNHLIEVHRGLPLRSWKCLPPYVALGAFFVNIAHTSSSMGLKRVSSQKKALDVSQSFEVLIASAFILTRLIYYVPRWKMIT